MKVLLTHAYFLHDDARERKIMRPYPPLGLLYLSAWLDEKEIENSVFDTTFSTFEKLQQHIIESKPDCIGIYTNLMTKLNVLRLIEFIRTINSAIHIILGGPEVRHNAESFLRHGAHVIVVGEGEVTLTDVISTLRDKGDLAQIAGIAFLKDDVFQQNTEREKVKDLDALPMPARHKIDLHQYLMAWRNAHGQNAISVSTMRGCPYTCKWCSRAVYGLSYRRRSPAKVADELASIKEAYNPDTVWFVDDVFTISHKWLREFAGELNARNLKIPYECITRADRMNEEVVQLLKQTGCFRVWIGAESGSQKVIDLMDRRVDVEQVRSMIQLSKRHHIESGTFIMLGYPGETQADIEETITHLKASDPDHFTITVAYPIKGTELYEEIEPDIVNRLDWSTSNDRQVDFKRTYSRRYYDFAVKRVTNEVNYFKSRNRPLAALKHKTKAELARVGMWWYGRRQLEPLATSVNQPNGGS